MLNSVDESEPLELSVVAPAYRERGNLRPLARSVEAALGDALRWELIVVDDGSDDGTGDCLRELARSDPRIVGVHLPMRAGQSAALLAGIAVSRGRLIATMDADLQNDPGDLRPMMAALGEADMVTGVRQGRCDTWRKRFCSRFANGLRNLVLGESFRDSACGIRLFRAEAAEGIPAFNGLHRFLPSLMHMRGLTVVEHPVSHHPRVSGSSKYGIGDRALRGLRDLFGVRWLRARLLEAQPARIDRSARRDDSTEPLEGFQEPTAVDRELGATVAQHAHGDAAHKA